MDCDIGQISFTDLIVDLRVNEFEDFFGYDFLRIFL